VYGFGGGVRMGVGVGIGTGCDASSGGPPSLIRLLLINTLIPAKIIGPKMHPQKQTAKTLRTGVMLSFAHKRFGNQAFFFVPHSLRV
jgi:hypothetical protein